MKPARILHAVHDTPQLPTELTLYAETRAIAKDTERWKVGLLIGDGSANVPPRRLEHGEKQMCWLPARQAHPHPRREVERIECQSGDSSSTEDNTASPTEIPASELRLARHDRGRAEAIAGELWRGSTGQPRNG
jgi:hypothetical protein